MTEKEELEDLVGSPGWQRLNEVAEREYGPGGVVFQAYYAQVRDQTNEELGQQLRALLKAQDAVRWLMRWPVQQLKRLEAQNR